MRTREQILNDMDKLPLKSVMGNSQEYKALQQELSQSEEYFYQELRARVSLRNRAAGLPEPVNTIDRVLGM